MTRFHHRYRRTISFLITACCVSLGALAVTAAEPIIIDFEDENLDNWTIVDEDPENLGDQGPSDWSIIESELGF